MERIERGRKNGGRDRRNGEETDRMKIGMARMENEEG